MTQTKPVTLISNPTIESTLRKYVSIKADMKALEGKADQLLESIQESLDLYTSEIGGKLRFGTVEANYISRTNKRLDRGILEHMGIPVEMLDHATKTSESGYYKFAIVE